MKLYSAILEFDGSIFHGENSGKCGYERHLKLNKFLDFPRIK